MSQRVERATTNGTSRCDGQACDRPGREPHGALSPTTRDKVQGTRMLKALCPVDGYTMRLTRKWIDELGWPVCPCGETLADPTLTPRE